MEALTVEQAAKVVSVARLAAQDLVKVEHMLELDLMEEFMVVMEVTVDLDLADHSELDLREFHK